MICWKCGKKIEINGIFRDSECPFCHADLRCCKGCRFYSVNSHFDCKENVAEPIADKEKPNFCDFFMKKEDGSVLTSDDKAEKARIAAAALFGDAKVSEKSEADSAKKAFNSLFGD